MYWYHLIIAGIRLNFNGNNLTKYMVVSLFFNPDILFYVIFVFFKFIFLIWQNLSLSYKYNIQDVY